MIGGDWPQDAVADHQADVENGVSPETSLHDVARQYGHTSDDLRTVMSRIPGGYEEARDRWVQTSMNKRTADAKLAVLDDLADAKPAIAANALARILTIQKALPNDQTLWGAAHKRVLNRARTNDIREAIKKPHDNA